MPGEDGLDVTLDARGRAADLTQGPPGLEGGDGPFDKGPDIGVGPGDGLLTRVMRLPLATVGVPYEPCCELGVRVTVAELGEGEQSLMPERVAPSACGAARRLGRHRAAHPACGTAKGAPWNAATENA